MKRQKREAAGWVARMRGPVSDGDREAFKAWHARPGNAEAFARAENDMAFARNLSRERIEALASREKRAPTRLRWATATIAAIALAGGFAWYLAPRPDTPQLATKETGQNALELADGSMVALMDGARIEPQFTDGRRTVLLISGRARFDVARDTARPFTVLAGQSETTALGTTFEVDLTKGAPHVYLIKGSVEVRASGSREAVRLRPGQSADVPATGPRLVATPAHAVPTTLLAAEKLPLGAIVDSANKANAKPIHLADPALAAIPASGRFDVADSAVLARRLAAALDLEAEESADEIVLRKK